MGQPRLGPPYLLLPLTGRPPSRKTKHLYTRYCCYGLWFCFHVLWWNRSGVLFIKATSWCSQATKPEDKTLVHQTLQFRPVVLFWLSTRYCTYGFWFCFDVLCGNRSGDLFIEEGCPLATATRPLVLGLDHGSSSTAVQACAFVSTSSGETAQEVCSSRRVGHWLQQDRPLSLKICQWSIKYIQSCLICLVYVMQAQYALVFAQLDACAAADDAGAADPD